MNIVLQTSDRTLLSLSSDELLGVVNALNEVCNGVHISDGDFQSRLGVDRTFLNDLHQALLAEPHNAVRKYQCIDVWAEPASVMVRAVSAYGDPVEMSTKEAEDFVEELRKCIEVAS